MAEWLRRQTQVLVNFVGVGSIPTGCTFFSLLQPRFFDLAAPIRFLTTVLLGWCSWLSRAPHTREVPSSILGSSTFGIFFCWGLFCVCTLFLFSLFFLRFLGFFLQNFLDGKKKDDTKPVPKNFLCGDLAVPAHTFF